MPVISAGCPRDANSGVDGPAASLPGSPNSLAFQRRVPPPAGPFRGLGTPAMWANRVSDLFLRSKSSTQIAARIAVVTDIRNARRKTGWSAVVPLADPTLPPLTSVPHGAVCEPIRYLAQLLLVGVAHEVRAFLMLHPVPLSHDDVGRVDPPNRLHRIRPVGMHLDAGAAYPISGLFQ